MVCANSIASLICPVMPSVTNTIMELAVANDVGQGSILSQIFDISETYISSVTTSICMQLSIATLCKGSNHVVFNC